MTTIEIKKREDRRGFIKDTHSAVHIFAVEQKNHKLKKKTDSVVF